MSDGIPFSNQGDAGEGIAGMEDLIATYLDRLNMGETLDPHQILADHPGLGHHVIRALREFVDFGAADESPPLGTLGDYTLRRQIGRGGMGVVYEAWENSMDRRVALKVLPSAVAADERSLQRFVREAKTAGQLSHPNVVSVYGMGLRDQTPYYAMEYVEGETLAQALLKIREAGDEVETPFGPKNRQDYFIRLGALFADVADGLQHAHSKGIIHRDIKPSNLILDHEGRLRILDFGLARLEGQESITVSGDLVGTVQYMSPEQAQVRTIPVDHRTDVYSLGATMYEMLTLRPPFKGKTHQETLSQIIEQDPAGPRRVNPRIPKDLETIVLKCLRKDPADRYGTAEALGQDLRRFTRGEMIEARPPGKWERFAHQLRRHRAKLLIVAAFVFLGGAGGWFAYRSVRAERERLRAEYGPAVFEAAVRLASGQFSLQERPAVMGTLGFSADALARFGVQDPRMLLGRDIEQRPVHEAVERLKALTISIGSERDAHYQLARAYQLLGKLDLARAEARLTLEIDREFVPAAALLADLNDAEGTTEQNVVREETGSAPATGTWQSLWLEAHHATRRSDWRGALKAYDGLIALSEGGEEPYIGFPLESYLARGAARLELGNCEGAQEDFTVARFLAPEALEATLLLGKVYFLEGRAELTEDLFVGVYNDSAEPRRDETALWVALVYVSLGDHRNALSWAGRLGRPSIRERLRTFLLLRLEDWDGAIEAGRSAVRADPENLPGRSLLATALVRGIALRPSSSGDEPDPRALELLDIAQGAVDFDAQSWDAHLLLRMAQETLRLTWEEFSRRKNMLIRKDSISARWIAALALATGAVGLSGSEICDDFSDRNVYDGDPIRWKMDPGYPAQLTYAACGLQVLDTGDAAGGLFSQEVFSGDVCIRARYSLNGTPAAVMLPLHWNPVTLCEYFVVLLPDGQFSLLRIDMGEWGPTWDGVVPFDPSTANCTIELRTVGPKVEFRAWPASGQRPQDPTMSIIDELYRVGIVGFGVQSDTNMSVCFHEVCIQSGSAAIEPVEDLTCSSPSCDEFALSWVCGQTYDEIVVAADGEVLETIGGDRTSYTGALPAGGVHQFSVKGVSEETESEARSCSVTIEQCPPRFARGDSNSDHKVNIADAVHTLSNLFAHGPAATCLDGADANDDGKVDIADAIAVLSHLFAHTGALPAPFGECGIDPTMDELGCQDYVPCN